MSYRFGFIILGIFFVLSLFLVSLVWAGFDDTTFQAELKVLQEHNESIRKSVEEKEAIYSYLNSDQYKDKYAKISLEKINPGETLALITLDEAGTPLEEQENEEIFSLQTTLWEEKYQKIRHFFQSLNVLILEEKNLMSLREYHFRLNDGPTVWFNMGMSIETQLIKLGGILKDTSLDIKKHIDLRIPGKVIYE